MAKYIISKETEIGNQNFQVEIKDDEWLIYETKEGENGDAAVLFANSLTEIDGYARTVSFYMAD